MIIGYLDPWGQNSNKELGFGGRGTPNFVVVSSWLVSSDSSTCWTKFQGLVFVLFGGPFIVTYTILGGSIIISIV